MPWFDTNYQKKRSITIDHTKIVGSSDLTSFPVLISSTNVDFKTVANGGLIQNASGFDIIFTNGAEDTKLDHEIEKFDGVNGTIIMWVRIPTLSHTVDTTIYAYYDNSTISTSQENATAVWDSNFHAVYHMKEVGGSTGAIKDSTSNANHANAYTSYPSTQGDISTTSGQIGNAQTFDGSDNAVARVSSSTVDITGTAITLSAWIKRSASNTIGTIIGHGVPGQGGYVLAVGVNPATTNQFKVTKYGVVDLALGTMPADTGWHLIHEVGDASGTYIYVDGSLSATSGNNQAWLSSSSDLVIGEQDASGDNVPWNGFIDEVRLSATTRTTGWIGTEYNSQNSPSTFYTLGSQQGQGISLSATLAGVGTLTGTLSRKVFLSTALAGQGTLTGTGTYKTALAVTLVGVGQFLPDASELTGPSHFLTATWVTRDMKATWLTRDMSATWITRR